jgi:CheY-like chemotaxis protein/two-component sensor histidine kinase
VIERQVRQMTRLVDDLLDVSRISRGRVELKQQPLDVREPLARAVEIASPLFENKAQHFEVQLPPHGLWVHGDATRLVQVFANLLNNAAKYTEPGGHIFMLVRQAGAQIVVEVRDDGMGIAPDLLPRVFDLFVQGQQASDRSRGGLGLGLSLVKTLVQLHGGEVEARTNGPRLGSSFVVRLPVLAGGALAGSEGDDADGEPATAGSGGAAGIAVRGRRRILFVEDNEDARVLLAEILTAMGHDVEAVADAPAALAVLARFTPEVAILDLGLPGIDGYQLATLVRRQLSGVRLIALSGYGQATDQARSRGAGFDLHFVKPVDIQRLLQAIALPLA